MRALMTGMLMAVALCAQAPAQTHDDRDVLYQVSTIDALLSGIYDTNGWDVQLPMVPAYLNADLGANNGGDLKRAEQGGAVPDASAH